MIPYIAIIIFMVLGSVSSFMLVFIEKALKEGLFIFIIAMILLFWLSISNYNSEYEVTSINSKIYTIEDKGFANQYYLQDGKLNIISTAHVVNPDDYLVNIITSMTKSKYGILWTHSREGEVTLIKKTDDIATK